MSTESHRDERLFELQERVLGLRQAGDTIDPVALAAQFELEPADVDACLRAADLLGQGIEVAPTPPELPEEFELLGELGRGGMGVVYRVHQKALGRDLALKVLRTAELDDAQSLSRFEHEARALARLRHPNIVGVHAVGRSGTAVYYTMDLVEGQDLAEVLRTGPLPVVKAVHLARQVADAVAHAHRQNILHRDLKPGNVLMDGDGNAHVVDFGLARDLSADRSRHTRTGQLLGTPGSMSPEQAAGDSSALGPATDVHGLGALLYEMLVGRPPFAAASLHELLRAVVENDPPRADAASRAVPRDLATVCEHAMARDRRARYPSAEAFGDDLRRFAEGQPIEAQPLGLASRTGRRLLREKRLVALGLVALLMAAVAFWVGSSLERADRTLELADSLRARGEASAALACVEANDVKDGGSDEQQRRLVLALLDCAERSPTSESADQQLARAASLIRPNYRITKLGGGSGGSHGGRPQVSLDRYRDIGFRDRTQAGSQTPPWSVLALRHAFLTGNPELVRDACNQFGMLGPNIESVMRWLAPARENPRDLSHASALGICLVVAMEADDVDDYRAAFPDGDAPQQLLVDLVRIRSRLPVAFQQAFERVVHGVHEQWRSFLSPGELAIAPLLEFANSPDASAGQRADAAALGAVAMGCQAVGVGRQEPQAVERILRDWNVWLDATASKRLQIRNDLAAWLWPRLPVESSNQGTLSDWFTLATGCPERMRDAACLWWQAHREDDPAKLLSHGSVASVEELLDRLGSASGSEQRRLHDLLTLRAGERSVPWPGGGPGATGTVADPERIAWIHAWLQAFDRASSREVRLRMAWLAFEDGAARPRVVARTSVRGRVGDIRTLDLVVPDVLQMPTTRVAEFYSQVPSNLLGLAESGTGIVQKTKVTFLPGAGGALALVLDESHEARGESQWRVDGRSSHQAARVATGDVGALATSQMRWRHSADRTVELVLMSALEDGAATDAPWSAQAWQLALERSLLATPPAAPPTRVALRAASRLPVPTARAVLARAPEQASPGVDAAGEEDYDYREDRWLALLLAGESDNELDEASVRGIGKRWYGAAFWGRLLRGSHSEPVRAIAREGLAPCEPGRAVARTLSATLSEGDVPAELAKRLTAGTARDWGVVGRWTLMIFCLFAWMAGLLRFIRTTPGTVLRQQARFAMLFGALIVWIQPVVVAGLALPPAWLWFTLHAGLFQLGQSKGERASWLVRLIGSIIIILAVASFVRCAGWWAPSRFTQAVLPPILVCLASFGMMQASVAREPRRPRNRLPG